MSKYDHFVQEIKAAEPNLTNSELAAKVKARIVAEDPAPTLYDLYGLPDPMNTDIVINGSIREKAASIIEDDESKLLIQYVRRSKPKVCKIVVDMDTGATHNKLMRGEPIGVLVAFVDDDKLFVGWSKYNLKKDIDNNQIEQLVFTKKDAVKTAVLRALTDNISENRVAFKIAPYLNAFIERAEKYFKMKVANTITTVGYA